MGGMSFSGWRRGRRGLDGDCGDGEKRLYDHDLGDLEIYKRTAF